MILEVVSLGMGAVVFTKTRAAIFNGSFVEISPTGFRTGTGRGLAAGALAALAVYALPSLVPAQPSAPAMQLLNAPSNG